METIFLLNSYLLFLDYFELRLRSADKIWCLSLQEFFVRYRFFIVLYFYSASVITNTTVKNKIKCDATELVRSPRVAFT